MSDALSARTSSSGVISEAAARQRMASDPMVSSWVGASAGSGKTKVLTDRMLRLLLPREDGSPASRPEKILALTFTKAGANEMALRLSKRLSAWAVMSDADLDADMEKTLLGRTPRPEEREAARKLFAKVVDTPGGLNIMTIHSFCQSVLGRFPIEAGLPPNFTPLEEEQAAELLEQAKRDVLNRTHLQPASPLSQAVSYISGLMNEDSFASLIKAILGERHQTEHILKRTFGVEGLYTHICGLLGIRPGLSEDDAFRDFYSNSDEQALRGLCAILAASDKKTDIHKADSIQAFWDAAEDIRQNFYTEYKGVFLTQTGTVKAPTKGVLSAAPDVMDTIETEASRILSYEDTRKCVVCANATRDIFLLGEAIYTRYQSLKSERGVLDFDDLILKTLSLLKGEENKLLGLEVTPWVLYKMDEGLEHILVDEAQDTNPEQWDIIRQLSTEFFSGLGTKDFVRSIFVVGDEKQSIFGFQRAAPEKFGEMYRWFDEKIRASGETFRPININTSFRSVQIVLDAVDAVFDRPDIRGLTDRYLRHIAKREGQAGMVEVWPVFKTTTSDDDKDSPEKTGWFLPDKITESQSGSLQMAAKIGDTIKNWLDTQEPLPSYGRPVRPGDILVLVRARNAFVGQLVRALKSRNVPVSGVDRMILNDQLVVQDLCAAAAFALLPDDDLTLASLLKSPFAGIDEKGLYDLAYGRTGSLWQAVKAKAPPALVAWLNTLIERVGADHPYEFFSRIVQEPCPANPVSGLRAIRTRLGEDAMDPLDEFLNITLTYESSHSAGMQGFLRWHEEGSSEIKRQTEEAGNAVRIMTVHGSKGLQAPIVFLPDTIRTARSVRPDSILWPHKSGLDVPLYIPGKDFAPEASNPAQRKIAQSLDEEYRRLLYVAMTRAEERLYIGGYVGKKGPAKDSSTSYWYEDIVTALAAHPDVVRLPSGVMDESGEDVPVLRLETQRVQPADKVSPIAQDTNLVTANLEPWLLQKRPEEPFPPTPLTPSRPSEAEPAAASPRMAASGQRFRRGTVTHKLMQILPGMEPARRKIAAEQFLARPALGLEPAVQKDIIREVFDILDNETFKDIFSEGSMAEVPVTGLLNGNRLISGQIDRLLVREDDILIVDYKTNRPPPLRAEDVPAVYVRQMQAYADTLRVIYPGRKVRCALLWTDGARLMEISV